MSNNPFDFTKVFAQYDPAAMNKQMQEMFSQFNVPNVDMKAIAESQQKNIDAVTTANRVAVEGMQELMQCQAKIFQEALKEGANLVSDVKVANLDTAEVSQKQTKLVEDTMKKALANATDLSDIVTKTQKETSKLITERFDAAIKELKDTAPKK
jgi:phasin family protein